MFACLVSASVFLVWPVDIPDPSSMEWNTVAFPVIPASTVDESDMEFQIKMHLFTVL